MAVVSMEPQRRESISDDWEELDGASSVHSLPSTPSESGDEDLLQFSDIESPILQPNPLPSPRHESGHTSSFVSFQDNVAIAAPARPPTPQPAESIENTAVLDSRLKPDGRVDIDASQDAKSRDETQRPCPALPSPPFSSPLRTGTDAHDDCSPRVHFTDPIDKTIEDAPENPFGDGEYPMDESFTEHVHYPNLNQTRRPYYDTSQPLAAEFLRYTARSTEAGATPDALTGHSKSSGQGSVQDAVKYPTSLLDGQWPVPPNPQEPLSGSFDSQRSSEYDRSQNPNVYHQAITCITRLLNGVAADSLKMSRNQISTLSLLETVCRDLVKGLSDLQPMYAAYAKHWLTQGADDSVELPLIPSLLDWMDHTQDLLTTAKSEIDRFRPTQNKDIEEWPLTADHIPLEVNCIFASTAESLEMARKTLEDFLPIIKADFDEFRTSSMHIPRGKVPRAPPPIPSISNIRRELYRLKDQLQTIFVFLISFQNSGEETRSSVPDTPKAIQTLIGLIEGITTILTNNASEWLESDLKMGMLPKSIISHRDYISLDPEVLGGIIDHLRDFYQQIDVRAEPLFKQYSDLMVTNHQITVLTEGGQMYNLLSTLSVLETLLLVVKDEESLV